MTVAVERLLREAESLSPEEREELALCLLDGLPEDPEHDTKWAAEIERRVREVNDGTVELVSGQDMLAIIDAAVRGKRRLSTDAS